MKNLNHYTTVAFQLGFNSFLYITFSYIQIQELKWSLNELIKFWILANNKTQNILCSAL